MKTTAVVLGVLLFLQACGPVNRFQVVPFGRSTMLIDTMYGGTWMACLGKDRQRGWCDYDKLNRVPLAPEGEGAVP